ncbi:MAG: FAD-binding oxidoreductase [Acidobacteriota bacterium]|nr:FAD-binding oxidoreductase [Acidobacteriota bacterium]
MQTAEVVIAGAGIVGSSIAYHLASRGCRDILVLERETQQGLGSTGKSMGGVRAQFAAEVDIRMSMYSIPMFRDFESITGSPSGYKPHGYLFMATGQRHIEALRPNSQRQRALGVPVELVTREEIVRILPQLRADDIVGGSFCPTDGFVDPYSVMNGFMSRAQQLGVQLWRGAEVTAIQKEGDRIAGVETTRGPVSTRTLVNAAGVWGKALAAMAGVDLPIQPLRRMLVPTEPFPGLLECLPMIIDMSTGFHFRQEGLGLLLAWNDPEETPGFKPDFDPAFIEKVLTRAADRVPCFEELAVNRRKCWAGLYDMSPDHRAMLGPAPGVQGFFLANGFSGHGVMHSPATGKVVSDLILDGRTEFVDAAELSMERFSRPDFSLPKNTVL